jgi:ferredoxin
MTVAVTTACTACGACLATCPTHALVAAPRRPRVVDGRCTDCWLCLEVCPVDAISPVPRSARPDPTVDVTRPGAHGGEDAR